MRIRVLLLVLVAPSFGGCDSWFYRPSAKAFAAVPTRATPGEFVSFATKAGLRLRGWWMRASGTSRGSVVYCYGYDKNLTAHSEHVSWLVAEGYNVLCFDYRGFGGSSGTPSRQGTIEDACAAIDFVLARDPKRTLVYGHSLGGAVGLVAAAKRPGVRGVIAEATFADYRAAARARVPFLSWFVPLLVSKGLEPSSAVAGLAGRPVLVVHGAADRSVPVALGRALYSTLQQPKQLWIFGDGNHPAPWGSWRAVFEKRVSCLPGEGRRWMKKWIAGSAPAQGLTTSMLYAPSWRVGWGLAMVWAKSAGVTSPSGLVRNTTRQQKA